MLVRDRLAQMRLPLIGAPMFLVSHPQLLLAQCRAGVAGCLPSLNARTTEGLGDWLGEINATLADEQIDTPYGVNLICHPTNDRLEADLRSCVAHQVPLVITSLHPPSEVIQAVHGYGGLVWHDVINARHAAKAAEQGVDGLILVCAGAGGHAGTLNPFAFLEETRQWYDGMLILAGAISTGRSLAAARVAGADYVYMGSRFIATPEANAPDRYREMLVQAHAADILYTSCFTGVKGNYLKASIVEAGLDPDNLPLTGGDLSQLRDGKKAWRDIWSAGQGVGAIDRILPVAGLVDQLEREYREALQSAC